MIFCAFLKQLCRNIDNHVTTHFQYNICKLVSRPKFSCRNRGLLPLRLTSCCSFVMRLRYDFLVLSIFAVTTQFSCSDKILLCSAYSFCLDPVCYAATGLLCIVLKSLPRHIKVCRNLVSLCSSYLCVVTLRTMSRHRLISST